MKYIAIRSEGGLIPYDLLEKIANEDAPGQKAADFGLAKGRRLSDEIHRVWSDAQDLWDIFNRRRESLPEKDPYGTTLTRERWILPLLTDPQILGYELKFQPTGVELHGLNFPISHWAGEGDGAPPVHIEGFKVDLDRKGAKLRTSPRAMVQEFLNHSDVQPWGIVTNGLSFRLLRNSARTARPTYLEFDLESILESSRFNEFAIFYRLCHRSRLPKTGQDPTHCLLETYNQLSIEQGGRVRDKLRDGVEDALKVLGTGFLHHHGNEALRAKVAAGRLPAAEYHRQLLRLVYRLLFLMVAEERRMIVSKGENAERHQRIYRDYYSVSRLRERAEGIVEPTAFSDLWLGLKQTFLLFSDAQETNPLGIPPLNGDLFSHRATDDLNDTQLYNHELLLAIRRLSVFSDRGVQQRVNYSALDVEELGSVYESLLDFHPVIEPQPSGLVFDLRTGSERKTTGSYYTRPELVHELIQSALVPVIEDRLAKAEKESKGKPEPEVRAAKEKAILAITVCDSACGSGHFLLAAARRLGRELARIRTGEDEPSLEQFQLGVRDAVSHCIYGVDLNPLAVDLCKLALWLEGHWTGKPLSFLDHRIKCGNSLVGVFDLEAMKQGIPDDAFNPVTGDDKKAAQAIKKRNKTERESPTRLLPFGETALGKLEGYAEQLRELADIAENSPADVRRKSDLYRKVYQSPESERAHRAADLWTSAFFVPIKDASDPAIPTHAFLMEFLDRPIGARPQLIMADSLKLKHHFFHWPLEFPEVFGAGGFDVVLGNPPWERIKLQEEEFFTTRNPEIAKAPNKAARQELIDGLAEKNPALAKEFMEAKHAAEAGSKFVRECGRFALTSIGDINTFALFAELGRSLVNSQGKAGIVVPTGIATDDTCKDFFGDLNEKRGLASLFDFENREALFPGVHRSYKFSLFTMSAKPVERGEFAFFSTRTEQLRDAQRRFTLTAEDLGVLNPNTRTCPVFRSRADAELTKKVYQRVPILVNERSRANPWSINFLRMIDPYGGGWNLLREPDSGEMGHSGEERLPVYEGKMFYQFDHRFASVVINPQNIKRPAQPENIRDTEKMDAALRVKPQYWVTEPAVTAALHELSWHKHWVLVQKKVTASTNERTHIAAILPLSGTTESVHCMLLSEEIAAFLVVCLLVDLNSFVFDYIARQKIGGENFNYFVTYQLPALPPTAYAARATEFIVPRGLELVYAAWDIKPFADDVWRDSDDALKRLIRCQWEENKAATGGHEWNPPEWAKIAENGIPLPPFKWDEDRRAQIRAELDAYYALLYVLTRDELRYILDPKDVYGPDFPSETFRVLKEKEEKRFGEYRTRRLVLATYDQLAGSDRFAGEKREPAIETSKGRSMVPAE